MNTPEQNRQKAQAIINKMRNNSLQIRGAEQLITLDEIKNRAGGLLNPLIPEDEFYIERIKDGIPEGNVTTIGNIASYMEDHPIQQTRRKLIEITDITESITIDLSQYRIYTKFRIQFPATRTIPDISISIEGITDLKYGLESIIMSGLGSDTDYLSSDKRGTITFTLDSADYEFPSSIYHFGSFATGGTPATIFLHIDYTEADSSSSFKYVAENAIYADTDKIACELWSFASTVDTDILPFKENTTLVFKHDGELLSSQYETINYQSQASFYINISNTNEDGRNLGSSSVYINEHLYITNMPILKATGFLTVNGSLFTLMYTYKYSGSYDADPQGDTLNSPTSKGGTHVPYAGEPYYSTTREYSTNDATTLFDMSGIRDKIENQEYWTTLPTDFGLYRVIVKGKFAQNQLNN